VENLIPSRKWGRFWKSNIHSKGISFVAS